MGYCIDQIIGDENLATPLIVNPKPFEFLQSGYNENDYYGIDKYNETLELHIAKLIYPTKENDILSHGFFAIDHNGNGTIIVSLRGTSNIRDYLTDINVNTINYEPVTDLAKDRFYALDKCDDCKVHNGFYKRFKEIQNQIFPTIEKLTEVFPNYRIVTTGHSMGGSLATLIGLELSLIGYKPLVITYGSPKVSNDQLSTFMDRLFFTEELFDENIMENGTLTDGLIRIVHKDDFIPLFPPGNSFIQSGFEFFIEKDDLPHPKSVVEYHGKARDINHEVNFKFWENLLSFNINKLFHLKEHSQYFYPISICDDITEKAISKSIL